MSIALIKKKRVLCLTTVNQISHLLRKTRLRIHLALTAIVS